MKARSERSFRKSFGVSLVGNSAAAALGALAILLTIRQLSPSEWAPVASVIGMGPSIGLVLSLGSVGYQTRRISRVVSQQLRGHLYATFVTRRFVIGGAVLCIGGLAAIRSPLSCIVLLLAGSRFIRGGVSVRMSCDRRFSQIAALAVGEKLVIVVWVGCAKLSQTVSWLSLPIGYLVSYWCYTAAALAIERPWSTRRWLFFAAKTPELLWSRSGRFGIASLTGPLQQADVAILGSLTDDYQAGLLGSGSRLTSTTNVIGGSLASVVMPYFGPRHAESLTFGRRMRRSVLLIVIAAAIVFGSLAATTSFWVPLMLGASFKNASFVISCYLLLAFVGIAIPPLMVLLQAWDLERSAMRIAIGQAVATTCAISACGWLWGANGAALGQLIVQLFVCGFLVGTARAARTRGHGPTSIER